MWFSVVCTLIDNDTRHHSGQNVFFGRSLPFLTLYIILKSQKNLCVGSCNYLSYTIKAGVHVNLSEILVNLSEI